MYEIYFLLLQALLSHLSPPHQLKLIMLADKRGRTAMDYAIRFKQQDMINLLLEHTMQASLHLVVKVIW